MRIVSLGRVARGKRAGFVGFALLLGTASFLPAACLIWKSRFGSMANSVTGLRTQYLAAFAARRRLASIASPHSCRICLDGGSVIGRKFKTCSYVWYWVFGTTGNRSENEDPHDGHGTPNRRPQDRRLDSPGIGRSAPSPGCPTPSPSSALHCHRRPSVTLPLLPPTSAAWYPEGAGLNVMRPATGSRCRPRSSRP